MVTVKEKKRKFSGFGHKTRAKVYAGVYRRVSNRYVDLERRKDAHVVIVREKRKR